MVKVFFETNGYAEHVATFESEEIYMACLPRLEVEAKRQGFNKVTESMDDGYSDNKTWASIRIISDAGSRDVAMDKIEANDFDEGHELSDIVVPLSNLILER